MVEQPQQGDASGWSQPGRFPCPRCGNAYRWKGNLTAHLRVECGKEPQQQCPHCPTRFKHKSHLKRHIRRFHPEWHSAEPAAH